MVKQCVWLLVFPLALAIGADKAAGSKPAPKADKPAAQATPAPKSKSEPVKTPFGVFTSPETVRETKEKATVPGDMTVVDNGDSLHFERKTPFGAVKWDRKKTELTEMEAAAWEKAKAGKPASLAKDQQKDKE